MKDKHKHKTKSLSILLEKFNYRNAIYDFSVAVGEKMAHLLQLSIIDSVRHVVDDVVVVYCNRS